ncbi:MAG: hypothetical protein ACTSQU_12620 [Promethearchaeota archaeon]
MSLFVWFYVYAHLHVSWERKIKKKEILEKEKGVRDTLREIDEKFSENKSTN